MNDAFDQVASLLESDGSKAAFDYLIERFRSEKNYPLLFEARLMKARDQLGLPLMPTEQLSDLSEEIRSAYDEKSIEAAREAGELFLAEGRIDRAWPYFRAVGETKPVVDAIDKLAPRDDLDGVIEVAFHERVHPRKGFELILANHGTCRAITCFGQYPDPATREESAHLLVRTLHAELVGSLKRVIERQDGKAPESESLPELIAGRSWLFEGNSYYIDTSHVISVVQFGVELTKPETLQLIVELTEYGKHLSEMFQHPGEPPFENVYEDHGVYLRALLGEDVGAAIQHFRAKVEGYDPDQVGSYPAQVLVRFLIKLNRFDEAIEVSESFLKDVDPNYLSCPTRMQLCQLANNYDDWGRVAREEGDLLSFAAASVQKPGASVPRS